jgi:hypothetical protein
MGSSTEDQGAFSSPFMTMDMSMMFFETGKVTYIHTEHGNRDKNC